MNEGEAREDPRYRETMNHEYVRHKKMLKFDRRRITSRIETIIGYI